MYLRPSEAKAADSQSSNESDAPAPVNEIMVKAEMKRLNNMIHEKQPLRNTLLKADRARIFPICKNQTGAALDMHNQQFWNH